MDKPYSSSRILAKFGYSFVVKMRIYEINLLRSLFVRVKQEWKLRIKFMVCLKT